MIFLSDQSEDEDDEAHQYGQVGLGQHVSHHGCAGSVHFSNGSSLPEETQQAENGQKEAVHLGIFQRLYLIHYHTYKG